MWSIQVNHKVIIHSHNNIHYYHWIFNSSSSSSSSLHHHHPFIFIIIPSSSSLLEFLILSRPLFSCPFHFSSPLQTSQYVITWRWLELPQLNQILLPQLNRILLLWTKQNSTALNQTKFYCTVLTDVLNKTYSSEMCKIMSSINVGDELFQSILWILRIN